MPSVVKFARTIFINLPTTMGSEVTVLKFLTTLFAARWNSLLVEHMMHLRKVRLSIVMETEVGYQNLMVGR